MKIRLSRKLKQMASALLVVMVLGGILCLFVMYYLSLVQQQNTLSVRSQAWNIAIAVTEAGIEEGLQAPQQQSEPQSATAGPPTAPHLLSHQYGSASAATVTPSPSEDYPSHPAEVTAGPM